jgi:dihydrofolate reductase
MRKIVVSQFVSLDGVVEDPGGSEDYKHGGWSFKFDRGDEGNKFKMDELTESDALLLGRKTYDGFAAAWPERDGDFADKFNGMEKYVVSANMDEPTWNNSVVIRDDVAAQVAKLKEGDGGNILVNGSVQLIKTLMENDLVDEYRLMLFPVVLGSGLRMFSDSLDEKTTLELTDTLPCGPDGVVVLTYVPKR